METELLLIKALAALTEITKAEDAHDMYKIADDAIKEINFTSIVNETIIDKDVDFLTIIKNSLIDEDGEIDIYNLEIKLPETEQFEGEDPIKSKAAGVENYLEIIDFENWDICYLDNDKMILRCGGDWQYPYYLTIQLVNGHLEVTDFKPASHLDYEKYEGCYKKGTELSHEEVINILNKKI